MATVAPSAAGPRFRLQTEPRLKEYDFRLSRFGQGISDFSGFFLVCSVIFREEMRRQFASEGADGGRRWKALSPRYAAWKERHYPGQKIGHLRGHLRSAMTGGEGYSETIGKTTASFGMAESSKARPYGSYFSAIRPVLVASEERGRAYQKAAHVWARNEAIEAGLIQGRKATLPGVVAGGAL